MYLIRNMVEFPGRVVLRWDIVSWKDKFESRFCEEILIAGRIGLWEDIVSWEDRVVRRFCFLRGQGCWGEILFPEMTGLWEDIVCWEDRVVRRYVCWEDRVELRLFPGRKNLRVDYVSTFCWEYRVMRRIWTVFKMSNGPLVQDQ